ncbi:hypothetical protein QW71_03955 [Paenibacillus sp. IHB B 3415]|uniref:hypothetical protein n=1 Tax=Paenibacillus sp. IHB B 3415 TaxID=867080 RepID=UPI00057516DC|nr:hypothetical protein [Paenibacillus sp. IHB B 3415]KHL97067.1 hypothetical protein QW71_03955 [Paenibacillus sp. IHB B 3415]
MNKGKSETSALEAPGLALFFGDRRSDYKFTRLDLEYFRNNPLLQKCNLRNIGTEAAKKLSVDRSVIYRKLKKMEEVLRN